MGLKFLCYIILSWFVMTCCTDLAQIITCVPVRVVWADHLCLVVDGTKPHLSVPMSYRKKQGKKQQIDICDYKRKKSVSDLTTPTNNIPHLTITDLICSLTLTQGYDSNIKISWCEKNWQSFHCCKSVSSKFWNLQTFSAPLTEIELAFCKKSTQKIQNLSEFWM